MNGFNKFHKSTLFCLKSQIFVRLKFPNSQFWCHFGFFLLLVSAVCVVAGCPIFNNEVQKFVIEYGNNSVLYSVRPPCFDIRLQMMFPSNGILLQSF